MFDDTGAPLPRWQPIEKLLRDYEADIERGREMCAILADYRLLEPFTLQASLKGGAMSFGGMHRVDERKLEFLNAAQHKTLIRKGHHGSNLRSPHVAGQLCAASSRARTRPGTATQSGRG